MPAGLADGVDGGVEAAGFGLNKTGNLFSVDVTEVQRRIAAGCRPGGAISRINQDGGIECQRGSDGLSTVDSDTGTICAIFCTEGALDVGAGRWAISAKITVDQLAEDEERLIIDCYLTAGGLSDFARVEVRGYAAGVMESPSVTLPMQLIASIDAAGGGSALVRCSDRWIETGAVHGSNLSIMAIRVGG